MRVALVVVLLAGIGGLISTTVHADITGTTGGRSDTSGVVHAGASQAPIISAGTASACTWTWLTVGQIIGLANQPYDLTAEELAQNATVDRDGVPFRVYWVVCPGLSEIRVVDPRITPGDLIPGLVDHASDLIELPDSLVNPPVEVQGVVNLGMWLAVEEASYDPITARAGAVWITVTPTIGRTTFEFGNGDDVVCEGFGVPIVDLETIDEGPCGYTYTEPGDYTLTITSVWELPYTSSSGPGSIAPLERTIEVPYEVIEIQTVGTKG